MFTGIVQTTASVAQITEKGEFRHFVMSVAPEYLKNVELGASIAINGVCLTVVEFNESQGRVSFDVIDETLLRTTLGDIKQNDAVNFERSLTFGKEIGGHLVSGHIMTTATLARVVKDEQNCAFTLTLADASVAKYVFEKGFIAVDGASLTIGEVRDSTFNLHLIPETLRLTHFDGLVEGDRVNIEIDSQTQVTVDTVERYLSNREQCC